MTPSRWRARSTGGLPCLACLACLAAIACGARYGDDPKPEPPRDEPAATPPAGEGPHTDGSVRPLSSGATEWVRTIDLVDMIDGDQIDVARVAVASDGEIAIVGSFRGVIDIGGRRLKSTEPSGRSGNVDTFVAKLTPSGELRWIKGIRRGDPIRQVRRSSGPTVAFGLSGDVVLSSHADGAVTIDNLASRSDGATSFIVQLDGATGKARWLTSVASLPQGGASVVDVEALDARDGKIAIAGFADGAISLPGIGGSALSLAPGPGVFLAVLDGNQEGGALVLSRFEGAPLDEAVGLAIAPDGAIVTAIRFGGPRFAVPGFVFNQATSSDRDNAFDVALVGMRADLGSALWAKSFGVVQPQGVLPFGFALTPSASPLLVGYFSPSYRFDPSVPELTSNGDNDVFYSEFSSTGEPRVVGAFGGTNRDEGRSIAGFANRDIVIGGRYLSSDWILAGKVLPAPGPVGVGYVYLRSATTTAADWVVTYASTSRADSSTVASVAASSVGNGNGNRDRVIAAGDFTGTIDLGSAKATSSAAGARESAFVTSIVR